MIKLKLFKEVFDISDILNESSSLSKTGLDKTIINYLHKEFNFDSNLMYDKVNDLSDYKTNMLITLDDKKVKIIYETNNKYKMILFRYEDGKWNFISDNFIKSEDVHKQKLETTYKILADYSRIGYVQRKKSKTITEYTDFFDRFRMDVLKKFNKYVEDKIDFEEDKVFNKILTNLSDYSDLSYKKTLNIIRNGIGSVRDLNFDAKMLDVKKKNLNDLTVLDNTLNVLDHSILKYEVLVSEDLDDFVNVKDISDRYGYDTLIRSFIAFLITRRINFIVKNDKFDLVEYDF